MTGHVRTALLLSLALLGLAFAPAARAELTPAQQKEAQEFLAQFTAKDFEVRTRAVDRLVDLGPDVLPLIRRTLAETADAEVKLRCELVLKGLTTKYGINVQAAKPAPRIDPEPSKITLSVRDARLADVLQTLADRSGNAALAPPAKSEDRLVSVNVKDATYWEALDAVCRSAGLVYRIDPRPNTPGLVLRPMANAGDAGVYLGPVAVKLDACTRYASLRNPDQKDYLSYSFSYYWEERLPVVAAQVQVRKAAGFDGSDLVKPESLGSFTWSPTQWGRGSKCGDGFSLTITDPPAGLVKVAEISGTVRLDFGTGERSVVVDNIVGDEDKSAASGNLIVTVVGAKWAKTTLYVGVDTTRGGRSEPLPTYPLGSLYGYWLVDPKGTRHRAIVTSSYSFTRLQEGKTRKVRNTPSPGLFCVYATPPQALEGAWSLLYVLPENTLTKEYPFKLENVPAP